MVKNQDKRAPHADDVRTAGGFLSLFKGLEPIVGLAPMAGFTEAAFRSICADEGASFTVTELISARGICYDRELSRSSRYLMPTMSDKPWGIQLFGFDPADFSFAIERLLSDPAYDSASFIDLNMGCPVPKVVRDGSGAALMKTPDLVGEIVAASVEAAALFDKPVTVKIRSGFDADSINAPEIARIAEQAGAAAVTVHARTRDQYYGGHANWKVIEQVRDAIQIPVIGNGDITSLVDLVRMREKTRCDGFQIGRAARGNPFLFALVGRAYQEGVNAHARKQGTQALGRESTLTFDEQTLLEVSSDYWLSITTRHLDDMICNFGEHTAIREMRAHFTHYFRGFHGASALRSRIMRHESRDGVMQVLEEAARQREISRQSILYSNSF
ncbi:MAG TPA: tRNA-dihydrouridine synthase [Bacillota bacterium]|nr:tRNA-dihydrouridine synthase [Bacillota bacterium]